MRLPKKTVSEYPDIMKEWDRKKNSGLNPDKLSDGSHTKAYWICSICGYSWKSEIRQDASLEMGAKNAVLKNVKNQEKSIINRKMEQYLVFVRSFLMNGTTKRMAI